MQLYKIIIALLPALAIASPLAAAEPDSKAFALSLPDAETDRAVAGRDAEARTIEARAVTCALTGSNVRYRQGPGTNYPADGQFGAAGTRVSFSCYTTGSNVNGNTLWNRIASGTGSGDYVSDYYISRSCSNQITTHC